MQMRFSSFDCVSARRRKGHREEKRGGGVGRGAGGWVGERPRWLGRMLVIKWRPALEKGWSTVGEGREKAGQRVGDASDRKK